MSCNIFDVPVCIIFATPVTGTTRAVSVVQGMHQGNLDKLCFRCDGIMEIKNAPLICLLLIPSLVFAHGGRTDKNGCHSDRKNGGYHCHNSGSIPQSQNFRASDNSTTTNSTRPQSLKNQPTNSQVRETNLAAYKKLVLETQYALNKLGYSAGKPDGVLGMQTVKAIQHFQVDNEMTVDGKVSYLLLEVLLWRMR